MPPVSWPGPDCQSDQVGSNANPKKKRDNLPPQTAGTCARDLEQQVPLDQLPCWRIQLTTKHAPRSTNSRLGKHSPCKSTSFMKPVLAHLPLERGHAARGTAAAHEADGGVAHLAPGDFLLPPPLESRGYLKRGLNTGSASSNLGCAKR